jgi:hypothetical protein
VSRPAKWVAGERDRPDVDKTSKKVAPERLIFIDETWTRADMAPLRAPCGHRLIGKVPHGRWKTMTFLAALRHDRIIANLPWATTAAGAAAFFACGVLQRLFEGLRLQRLLAEQPVQLPNLALQSLIFRHWTTASPLPAAVNLPCHQASPREQLVRCHPMPAGTKLTVVPGSKVSSTMRTFSEADQRRRR